MDLAAAALLLLLAIAAGFVFRDYAPDDAFITYRYALNLASGQGFVYNPGEHVLGTSTPLYTLVLAVGHLITRVDIPRLSNLIGVMSYGAASIIFYMLGRNRDRRAAMFASLLFVTNPILMASLGMETPLLLLLTMAAIAAHVSGKRLVAALVLGMLIFLRFEMGLFAALLGVADWLRSRHPPIWLWPTAALGAIGAILVWAEFGQLVPQSAIAKLAGYRLPFLVGGLVIWEIYANQLRAFYILLITVVLGLYYALRTASKQLPPGYRILLVWGAIYGLAAAILAGSFPWYYAPLMPALAVLVSAGSGLVAEILAVLLTSWRASADKGAFNSTILALLMVGMAALQTASWTRAWVSGPEDVVDSRVQTYLQISNWLVEHAEPGSTLASFEIGALGYYTDLYVIDLSGLISPDILPDLGSRDRMARMRSAILRFQPDYALVPSDLAETFRYPSADIQPAYSVDGLDLYAAPD